MTRVLKLALVNVLFALALGTLAILYEGKIHAAGVIASACVLAVFAVSAAYALRQAYHGETADLELPIAALPMLSMLGTIAGFLIAFSADAGDVQERVLGASTGLVSTFVGIACAIVLMVEQRLVG